MQSLILDLWAQDGMADSMVILSSVLRTTVAAGVDNRVSINEQYQDLARSFWDAGRPIFFIDINSIETSDLTDGIHPNDFGHAKFAYQWYEAISNATWLGLVPEAEEIDPSTGTSASGICDKTPEMGTYAGGLTQRGSGVGDGIYMHESHDVGIIWEQDSDFDRGQWFFAR